ncbi:MAG: hypothetical protein AAF289_00125 [Cyanobacteria bacterium P01_A01_bin.135]
MISFSAPTIVSLLLLTAAPISSQGVAELAAPIDPIAQTNEPATARPAIAAVDPNQPIQIRVVNQSDIDVNIASRLVQPASDERIAEPQGSVTFGRLHTSYLPVPIDLSIFARGNGISLENLQVAVVNNEIIITVAAAPGVAAESRAIRVDEAGNIYLY